MRSSIVASIVLGLAVCAASPVAAGRLFGDIKIDHTVEGGADVQRSKVLEPEVPPKGDVATVVLNIRAGLGDVEVRRAA